MSLITLEGMEFFAYHGCSKEEQTIGTRFIVDFSFENDTSLAEKSDGLADTINYQSVYALIRQEMEQPSHLLEHIARRILDRICSEYPQIEYAEVTVSKLNPQLGGKTDRVSITLSTED
jgi:dihydroneopterin aldolase